MKKVLLITLVFSLTQVGCVMIPAKVDNSRECERNFSKQGFINFRTEVTLEGISKQTAMKRLVKELGRKGFDVSQNDVSEGLVSGTFGGSLSGFQFSAFLTQSNMNTNVELNYKSTGAGIGDVLVPEKVYMNDLCNFSESMKN